MQPLRIGMVGAGAVASRHVASLATLDGATVVGVTDEVEERAAALATAAGGEARPYASLEAMLAGAGLDAAYVCVPPYAHGPPSSRWWSPACRSSSRSRWPST